MAQVAVWACQGGGKAIWNGECYVFVESPDWWPDAVGSVVPREWDMIPANQQARDEMINDMWKD